MRVRITVESAFALAWNERSVWLEYAGYDIEGTDISILEIERAPRESLKRKLDIQFRIDDMRLLATCEAGKYGAVIAFDNAIPHLDSDEDVAQAFAAMRRALRSGGHIFVSLRDYGALMAQRPTVTPPAMFMDSGLRRIVHQVWDWHDDRRYSVHLYITLQTGDTGWTSQHFVGHYRAITTDEIAAHITNAGFENVRILSPRATGYYQPIVIASIA
jgi:SAM-dependent methyltransferase